MMGSKKNKDALDENFWRTQIEQAVLDDDNWKVKVIIIEAAGSDQDRIYLDKFATFAIGEKRFVIKNICKTETIFMINQLGSEKKIKDDGLRVFEEAQKYLSDKKDIPSDILALIIKHLILKMKEEYLFIQRQRLQVREGLGRESTTMIDGKEVRGTVGIPPPVPLEPLPPTKGKGKKEVLDPPDISEPPEGKKYNTSLRVRGEEWRDKVYVDDFPVEGPNIYVIVTGFADPYIPGHLVKIGIPLTAVVQIRINANSTNVPSGLIRSTKRGQSQTELLIEKSFIFWETLQSLRIHRDHQNDYADTAFIMFMPPYSDTDTISSDPEKIYDEICFLMYDIQDLSRQYQHYLENIHVIKIPEGVEDERYINSYHQQIDDLPLECVTIYSVLDSILNTVSHSSNLEESMSTSSTNLEKHNQSFSRNMNIKRSTDESKLGKTENLINDVYNALCKTEEHKKSYRLTYGEEYETNNDPIVINYGDFASYATFQLGNINLNNIVVTSLLGMPINNLWLGQSRLTEELEAKINFHVNILLSCFEREDIETAELNRLIHILACRKLYNNRSSLKKRHLPPSDVQYFKKKYLKRSVLAQPLHKSFTPPHSSSRFPSFPSMFKIDNESNKSEEDHEAPRIKVLFDCPDISELVSAAEIANYQPINHMIDEFEDFEDFSMTSGFQVMLEAFNKFNCVDYKYCEVTDCFLLMFFNSHDNDGIAREEWRSHLATPLCLQDFFDFILDEHYDWIQNEEKLYYENIELKSKSESKDLIDPNAMISCIDDTDVETDLLMDGSLKYQEIIKVEIESTVTNDIITSSKNSPVTTKSSPEIERRTSIKSKTTAITTPKDVKLTGSHPHSQSEQSVQMLVKPFLGYDLGNRRVEAFGRDSIYFSKDGTKIATMYTLLIPMNVENIVLSVLPGNSNNEFWIHKALGEVVKQEITDTCESFRITTKDQLMINIIKQTYELPICVEPILSDINNMHKKGTTKSPPGSKLFSDAVKNVVTQYYHSLFITWPNGLIIESVHENNSPVISHIKQFFIRPLSELNEDMRCISLNGEVIIFRPSGIINVLKPDGSYISITNYHKKVVISESTQEPVDDTSEKSKKTKGKSKDKPSRSSSKSSKIPTVKEDTKSLEKIEYRLVIEEFEIIEANGLRQKWINDMCYDLEQLLVRTATDFSLGEVFSRRLDKTHVLLNTDGVLVVTFSDQTRIITAYEIEDEEIQTEWTDEERAHFNLFDTDEIEVVKSTLSQNSFAEFQSYDIGSVRSSTTKKSGDEENMVHSEGFLSLHLIYTIEHANFGTVTINKSNGEISIDSPNETTVKIHNNHHYDFVLDSETSAKFNGKHLDISYEACPECKAFTTCSVKIISSDDQDTSNPQPWLKMNDSFCKNVYVDEEGSINLFDEYSSKVIHSEEVIHSDDNGIACTVVPESTHTMNTETQCEANTDERLIDGKSESSMVSHGKCREMYLAKNFRFFVLKRDLTCAELVHRALVDQYKQACRWLPWCSINQYDSFGDNRGLVSILTPVHLTESEKWLMNSSLSGKPKYLQYKDLKKDCGKGFYHWMRPYKRFESQRQKPNPVLPTRLPRAFVLRILERQWSDERREELKGAKELLRAVLRYRYAMDTESSNLLEVPIIDQRQEDERRIDDIIQALAQRVYMDLKTRIADDIQSRAKPTITTAPPPVPSEPSFEGESDFEDSVDLRALEEERQSLFKESDAAEEMSPALQRYWRRRSEEAKEELFYKYLLRDGSVPPYFRNVLGGAMWWDINEAAGEAVTNSERKKMTCSCAGNEACSHGDDNLLPFM